METPLPGVIFKYDGRAGNYLPANHLFQAHLLKGIEERINRLPAAGGSDHLSQTLDILLDYLYAGKEEEGWSFFDRAYHSPDKLEIRSKVKAVLAKAPAYRFIRERSQARRK
jgi:hypothetical protein